MTLHLISHTHWDREWYLTFQQFRLKLVHLIDHLLRIFETDPDFQYFMLDGQTIALEDYLAIRPEREQQLRELIAAGRLIIGPWYVLCDEFLVSPEAIVRNLLVGRRLCQDFGGGMPVGYIPDPFGHISQMPQILRGFGIDTACFWRGLSDEPCEVNWCAPDGSQVLTAYLRESYSNAANLPMDDPAAFTAEIQRLGAALAQHSASCQQLLMHGTDHAEPASSTSACLAYAQNHLPEMRIQHSTLPQYFEALRAELAGHIDELPVVQGELRACRRMSLLPGVLSSRMWIKQRNHACQNILERWAEPFSAWAAAFSPRDPLSSPYLDGSQAVLRQAWRLLLQCHPHDSICGCSIDAVHEEMRSRFDQVEQIGEELTRQSLEQISLTTHSLPADTLSGNFAALQVFNPAEGPRTDLVAAEIDLPEGFNRFEVVDEPGAALPVQLLGMGGRELFKATLDKPGFQSALGMVRDGVVAGMVVRKFHFERTSDCLRIDITLADSGQVDGAAWKQGIAEIKACLADPAITAFRVQAHSPAFTRFILLARDVPGYGYRTFWVRGLPASAGPDQALHFNPVVKALLPLAGRLAQSPRFAALLGRVSALRRQARLNRIENEYFAVVVDGQTGWISFRDKRSGQTFSGLNRFVDGGDCGDTYNYCPPVNDHCVEARVRHISIQQGEVESSLEIDYLLSSPASLSADRLSRSGKPTKLHIHSQVRLTAGVPRVEFLTDVENTAQDHRLRVHFPTAIQTSTACFAGHFDLVSRPLGLPACDASWVEKPRPEAPQRGFTLVQDGQAGLLLAARGLPEVQVAALPTGAELRLTLLRCVGWLSRDDLTTRQGHAGPGTETPAAQLPGRHHFEYALVPFTGPVRTAILQAHAFDLPLRCLTTSLHPGALPSAYALVETGACFTLTCIKQPEEGPGLIVRGFLSGAEADQVALRVYFAHTRCEQVRLDETAVRTLQPDADGFYRIAARPWEIITIKLF
jgi:hypothetical protein